MNPTLMLSTLKSSFLFKDASDAVLQAVANYCQPMELAAGETLFEQDSEADALYFLEEGQIHIVRTYPNGDEVILATEVPDYVIGELSMLANQPRSGSVVAIGDCELLKLSREAIIEVCNQYPDLAVRALTQLGNRLYQLNLRVRESAIGNVSARVASVVLMLCHYQAGQTIHEVRVTRIARATAMDADVVERLLKQWDAQGILHFDGQELSIHNLAALQALAG